MSGFDEAVNNLSFDKEKSYQQDSPVVQPKPTLEEEEEYKAAELHLETLSMMTKYQIVYIRLETAVSKLAKVKQARESLLLLKAFKRYRTNVKSTGASISPSQLLEELRVAVKSLGRIYTQKQRIAITKVFNKWKSMTTVWRLHSQKIKTLKENEEKYRSQLLKKGQAAEMLEKKLQQKSTEINLVRESEARLKTTIKDKEHKEKALKDAVDRFSQDGENKRSFAPKKAEEKLQIIETKARALEKENQALREQVQYTEGDLTDFVNEMNGLLDSVDFTKLDMEDERNVDSNKEYEGIIGGGTGGLIKEKSGPSKKNETVKMPIGSKKYKK